MSEVVQIEWDDVIALAPELATVSELGQEQILDQTSLEVNVARWGSLSMANAAALWLARHLATFYGRGSTGQVTSVSVGSVSKSFSSPTDLAALQSTRYGGEYLRLVRLYMPRFALT